MGDVGAPQGSLSHSSSRICPLWVHWELEQGPDLSPPAPQEDDPALGSPQNPSPTVPPQPPPSCRGNNCLRWELFPYSCSGRHKPGGGRLSLSSGAAPPPHSGGGRFGGARALPSALSARQGWLRLLPYIIAVPCLRKEPGLLPPPSPPSSCLLHLITSLITPQPGERQNPRAAGRQAAGSGRAGSGQRAGRPN